MYFRSPLYARAGWSYRPWCVIPTNNLFIHLWLRPSWGSYYFGNYYGAQFASRGFMPWASLGVITRRQYVYDPFYSYARVHYRRQGVDYLGRVQGWHNYYAQHADLRPARTWHEQQQMIARGGKPAAQTQLIASNIADVARRNDTPVRLTRLDDQAHKAQKQHADQLREFHVERSKVERSAGHNLAQAGPRLGAPNTDQPSVHNTTKLTLPKTEVPTAAHDFARNQAGGTDRAGGDRGGPDRAGPDHAGPDRAGAGIANVPPPKPTPVGRVSEERTRFGAGRNPARLVITTFRK